MKKKRIQKAVKHPGAFKKYCGGKVTMDCINKGLKSNDPKIRKMASLARTFMNFKKKK